MGIHLLRKFMLYGCNEARQVSLVFWSGQGQEYRLGTEPVHHFPTSEVAADGTSEHKVSQEHYLRPAETENVFLQQAK